MEFLVEFEVHIPDGATASEVELRTRAEAGAAAKLVDGGHLVRLWRVSAVPGKAVGVYRADTQEQLAGLLGALPLSDWMHVTVNPLEPHPNDRTGQPSRLA
jgi:muconolactone D-isomerase